MLFMMHANDAYQYKLFSSNFVHAIPAFEVDGAVGYLVKACTWS